jgi:tagatose 1,6-diphosphate aldolase
MNVSISSGKQKGLQAVADSRGVIAALAIDQRGAMRALFARAMGIEPQSVPDEKLVQFKEAVSSTLTSLASAILLDPEFGLPAAQKRAPGSGLLLAYEVTGYDKNIPGRLPRLLDHWSVPRLIEVGANAVKLLLYYSDRSTAQVNDIKSAFVQRIGGECVAADVPFFLELVSYHDGMDEKAVEFARIKHEVVTAGTAEFTKPQYRVDVLKVGMPVNLSMVETSPTAGREILHTREAAQALFREAAAAATVPFIYLSEGVSNETFQFGLELAAESGVKFSGVLCGRATWKDGVEVFVRQGAEALQEWLRTEGTRNIENVNNRLSAATPWFEIRNVVAVS